MTTLTADARTTDARTTDARTTDTSARRELPVTGAWLPVALVVAVLATVAAGLFVDLRAAAGIAGTSVLVIALVGALRGTNVHGTATSRA